MPPGSATLVGQFFNRLLVACIAACLGYPMLGLADNAGLVKSASQANSGVGAALLPRGLIDIELSAADHTRLTRLELNAKFLNATNVLADLKLGTPEIAIIVTLQSTNAAKALSTRSHATAQVPESFRKSNPPDFYNLKNPEIKEQLRATVSQRVEDVISQLGNIRFKVTQRFSYQFGFAALVNAVDLEAIINHPMVLRVEKDEVLEAHLGQGIPLMNATSPRLSHDGTGISVAICDTGIDTAHPRLGGGGNPIFNTKVIGGYDTGDNDADPRPASTGDAHGTACAGIAAGDNGTVGDYIGGVAPGAKLYAIKISQTTGGSATSSSMIAGWEWAVTHQNDDPANPIMIISTSFGGGSYAANCDAVVPAMTTAAANAVAAGITIFASSGNDGYCASMGWPACISHVNSVGAVYDANIGMPGWCVSASSCVAGKFATAGCSSGWAVSETSAADKVTAYSNSASFLTLFGPSNNAYTADITGAGGYAAGDYTTGFGGTSAATPYAAGAATVLQSAAMANNGAFLTPAQVRQYLVDFGDLITDGKVAITKPRVNLENAVAALTSAATYALTVNSTGVSGLAIGSGSGHGGTTNYSVAGIDSGTDVSLTAPGSFGSAVFTGWVGCTSAADTACTVTMTTSKTVIAGYLDTMALTNGVPVANLTGALDAQDYFSVAVPSGASNLLISISGGTGDADLYVRFGGVPSLATYDCRPWLSGNTENCSFPTPTVGTYFIMLHGYAAYTGVTLTASYDSNCPQDEFLTLENTALDGAAIHTACRTITVGPALTVNSAASVTLQAGEGIIIRPEFRVRGGGVFRTVIDPSLIPQ